MFFVLTMFILLVSMYTLIRGNIFCDASIAAAQYEIDKIDGKKTDNEAMIPGVLMFLFALVYVPMQIALVYNANSIDVLRYPTITMFTLLLLNFARAMVKAKPTPGTDEEKRAKYVLAIANVKRRTFKGTMLSLAWTSYALYILWIIMGGAV